MNRLENEFSSRGIWRGGLLLFDALTAIEFIQRCQLEALCVLGVDTFQINGEALQPLPDHLLDVSGGGCESNAAESIQFIRQRAHLGLVFEITTASNKSGANSYSFAGQISASTGASKFDIRRLMETEFPALHWEDQAASPSLIQLIGRDSKITIRLCRRSASEPCNLSVTLKGFDRQTAESSYRSFRRRAMLALVRTHPVSHLQYEIA